MNDQMTTIMSTVSDLIRTAEVKMRLRNLCCPAEFETLKWEMVGKHFRITFDGTPLQACPFENRAAHFEKLPGLIDAAKLAVIKKFGQINQGKVREISDIIEDL